MPLALGGSFAPSAHAEPQRFSNSPQLPPPELEIRTTVGLTPELPQSNSETGEGKIQGAPAIFPAKGRCQGLYYICFPSKVRAASWMEQKFWGHGKP